MTKDAHMFAVMIIPLKGPAPILSTIVNPAKTASAPANPPKGAHQGIEAMEPDVGNGLGIAANAHIKNAKIKRNETKLASHGFCNEFLSCAFMEFPKACIAPAKTIKRYSQNEFISLSSELY